MPTAPEPQHEEDWEEVSTADLYKRLADNRYRLDYLADRLLALEAETASRRADLDQAVFTRHEVINVLRARGEF